MKILVTGGTGYIGSHTVVALTEAGYDVTIVDDLSNSDITVLDRLEKITGKRPAFYECNINNRERLEEIFRENDFDAVIHFAAFKAVGESCANPVRYFQNNVCGTVTLLSVMRDAGCKSIVFSSSATVYGEPETNPMTEEFPLHPVNPYGTTKVIVETMLRDLYKYDNSWKISILRYFNPIGAHESGLIGEKPNGIPNNIMPYICLVAVGKAEKLRIFGDDYPTVDGTGVRDYIHVCDLASGHVAALKYISENGGCEAVNLGCGRGHSVLELVNSFERVNGVKIPYEVTPRRPGDLAEYYGDPSKALRLYGWKAKYTIDDMLRTSYNFMKNAFDATKA